MIVADNSAIVAYLIWPEALPRFEEILQVKAIISAPDIIDFEFLSALRRMERHAEVTPVRALEALSDFMSMPVSRYSISGLMNEIWELRHNFSAYDASYVALARMLDVELVTRDGKLARAAEKLISVIHI